LADNRGHLYTLDGYGGLHAANGSPSLSATAYWQGWDIARGLALLPAGDGGYTLDGYGGLHAFGAAPASASASAYWPGWDIARGIVLAPWADTTHPAGWVLDGYGGLHPFGGAPWIQFSAYWNGWDIARALVISGDSLPASVSGYVLDGYGGLHPIGTSPFAHPGVSPSAYWPGTDIARGLALLPAATASAPAGYVLDGWGGIHPFGGAPAMAPGAYWPGWDIAKTITTWSAAPAGSPGGWVLDGWGALHKFGSAADASVSGYWPGWDIARAGAGAGSGGASRHSSGQGSGGVPFYRQTHNLDCEAAALQMALASRGIMVSQDTILGAMPTDGRSGYYDGNGRLRWGDPYAAFVGSVDGSESNLSGYGVYYPPIAAAAQHFGAGIFNSGEGIGPQSLYDAVAAGHVAVAWVTVDWTYRSVSFYQAFDGRSVMYTPSEHAVTVVGVNGTSVLVNNPLRGQQWIAKSTFESAYATLDNMAVIVF
jgi:uncharacterized protein YvpB